MAPTERKDKGTESTLRSLRHSAAATRPAKVVTKTRATASLTVKQKIARRAAKPIIQGRQFKWISPAQRMKDMSVDMGRVRDRREMLEDEAAAGDDETHSLFAHALATSQQLNLSLPFIAFSRQVEPKSRSLPLVTHHREAIVAAVCSALRSPQADVALSGEHILESVPYFWCFRLPGLTWSVLQPSATAHYRPGEPPPPVAPRASHDTHPPHRAVSARVDKPAAAAARV